MEVSRNVYTEPMGLRLRRAGRLILDHILVAPDHSSNHYRPTAQRDVGKSATKAAQVADVIRGIQIERPSAGQLDQTMQNRWDDMGNYLEDGAWPV